MAVGERLDSTELELLLPFHATGTLSNRDASTVELGLAASPALTHRYRRIQCERADIVRLGDSLGQPSDRPLARLLAAVTDPGASKRRMAKGAVAAEAVAAAANLIIDASVTSCQRLSPYETRCLRNTH